MFMKCKSLALSHEPTVSVEIHPHASWVISVICDLFVN
jgi:hypothetical protein